MAQGEASARSQSVVLQSSSNSSGEPFGRFLPLYQRQLPFCLQPPCERISWHQSAQRVLYSGRCTQGILKKMWSSTHFASRLMPFPWNISAPASATDPYTPLAEVRLKLLQIGFL